MSELKRQDRVGREAIGLPIGEARTRAGMPVKALYEVGLTVSNMDRSLAFYRDLLGFTVVVDRVYTEDYIFEVLGSSARSLRLALLEFPGSPALMELIEFHGVQAQRIEAKIEDYGVAHLGLYVDDIESTAEMLRQAGAFLWNSSPIRITGGPNEGCKIFFAEDPDGFPIEFLWRP